MFDNKIFEKHPIKSLFDLQLGKTPSRDKNAYWNDGSHKWISVADMKNYDRFTKNTEESISDIAINETGIRFVPANTVIMSFKLTIGRTAITSENIYTNEAIIAFLNKGVRKLSNDYLRVSLSQHDWRDGQMNAVKGMTLNSTSIGNTLIEIPPIDLQNDFTTYVEQCDKLKFNE